MSKKNRRQREQARQQREVAAPAATAEVQTPAPIAVGEIAGRVGVAIPADEVPTMTPPWGFPKEQPKPARKFGKPKVFDLGCGITVTIKGDDETLESEFWPVFEGNELHLYSGDAALDRRIAKQQGVSVPTNFISQERQSPAPPPLISDEARNVQGPDGYNGIGRRPKYDPQDEAMKSLGIDFSTMAESVPGVARLAAVPDEVIAP